MFWRGTLRACFRSCSLTSRFIIGSRGADFGSTGGKPRSSASKFTFNCFASGCAGRQA